MVTTANFIQKTQVVDNVSSDESRRMNVSETCHQKEKVWLMSFFSYIKHSDSFQCVDEVEEKFLDLVYHSPTKWLVFLKLQQVVYQFQECEVNKDEWISCEDQKYSREAYTLLVQSDVERRETIDRRPASTSPMGLTKKIERRSSTIR